MAGPRAEIELVLAPQFVANPAPLIEHFKKWLAALPTPLQPGAVPLESLPAGARSCLLAARVCEPELGFDVEDGIDGDGHEDPGSACGATRLTPLAELVRGHRGCDARSVARFHLRDVSPVFLAYHLCAEGATSVDVAADAGEGEGAGGSGGGDAPAYTHLVLPAAETEGLWESLVLHPSVKRSLLSYSASSLLFGDAAVDPQLVAWNHVVLLHGPPGTGKTSLCKALAHKLSARLLGRYPSAALIEINAHSLFSRWFSESGKLVTRLFGHITELVEGGDVFVFLLVDEVESLTAARSAAVRGSEPSDAVRVVNAVLTAIDALRARPNVLLLATSNVSEAIDVAFIDRADVRLHIGHPDAAARFAILGGSFAELCRAGVAAPCLFTPEGRGATAMPAPAGAAAVYQSLCERIAALQQQQQRPAEARGVSFCPSVAGPLAVELLTHSSETAAAADTPTPMPLSAHDMAAVLLLGAALASEGFSGRALRKLPLQAHARFVRRMGPAPALRVALAFLQYAAWEAGNRRGEDKALAQ